MYVRTYIFFALLAIFSWAFSQATAKSRVAFTCNIRVIIDQIATPMLNSLLGNEIGDPPRLF